MILRLLIANFSFFIEVRCQSKWVSNCRSNLNRVASAVSILLIVAFLSESDVYLHEQKIEIFFVCIKNKATDRFPMLRALSHTINPSKHFLKFPLFGVLFSIRLERLV